MTIPLSLGVGPRSPRVKPHRWVREPTRDLQKFDKRFFPLLLGLVDRISNVGIEPFFFFIFRFSLSRLLRVVFVADGPHFYLTFYHDATTGTRYVVTRIDVLANKRTRIHCAVDHGARLQRYSALHRCVTLNSNFFVGRRQTKRP